MTVNVYKLQLLLLFCAQILVINCSQEDIDNKKEWADEKISSKRDFIKDYPILADGFRLTGLNFQAFMTKNLAGHYAHENIMSASEQQVSRLHQTIEGAEKIMVTAMRNQLKNDFDQAVRNRTSFDLPSANILKYAHNYKESFGDEILHELRDNKNLLCNEIKNGHMSTVKQLLDCGADVNALSSYGSAPLHYAADLGKKKTMTLLLDRGAKIDIQNKYGKTPLFVAVEKSNFGVVEKLTDRGADVNFVSKKGLTPLGCALLCDSNTKIIDRIIKRGASDLGSYVTLDNKRKSVQNKIAMHSDLQTRKSLRRKQKDNN